MFSFCITKTSLRRRNVSVPTSSFPNQWWKWLRLKKPVFCGIVPLELQPTTCAHVGRCGAPCRYRAIWSKTCHSIVWHFLQQNTTNCSGSKEEFRTSSTDWLHKRRGGFMLGHWGECDTGRQIPAHKQWRTLCACAFLPPRNDSYVNVLLKQICRKCNAQHKQINCSNSFLNLLNKRVENNLNFQVSV